MCPAVRSRPKRPTIPRCRMTRPWTRASSGASIMGRSTCASPDTAGPRRPSSTRASRPRSGLISAGKEADVYLCGYNGAPLAVKAYRLYRTSHRGGRPIKVDTMSWLAAHEFEMMRQAWKGGAPVPTPARRVENLLSMRYIGNEAPAPRLHDVRLESPESFLRTVLAGVDALAHAGIVHGDLSAFNILVDGERPWFIDFSEAVRVDRLGVR